MAAALSSEGRALQVVTAHTHVHLQRCKDSKISESFRELNAVIDPCRNASLETEVSSGDDGC